MGTITDWLLGRSADQSVTQVSGSGSEDILGGTPHRGILPPARTPSARTVTQGDALSLSSVYRAINVHATAASQLSIEVHRKDANVGIPPIVRRPDVNSTQRAFVEQSVISLAVEGNAYWRIARDDSGKVTNLAVENPHDVTIDTDDAGTVTGYRIRSKAFKPNDVQHLALMRIPGTPYGLGPIQAAQRELRGHLDTAAYGSNWFEDGDVPTGVLKSDQPITQETAKQAKQAWKESQGGTRDVAVLGNNLTYTPIFLSPKDAQFVESQQFTVTQVSRLFGVPSSLMLAAVEGNTQTYANIEQDWIGYLRFSLMRYLLEIEDALSGFISGNSRVRFNVDALLRSDTKTRYEAHEIGLRAGFLSKDEVRAIENLGPLDPSNAPEAVGGGDE